MTEAALEHARLLELVAAFADGELSPDQGRVVREHLRTCARCRRELALQQDLAETPPAGLAYRWRGIVVVQYLVPTELIRRPPEVREALRGAGFYATSEQGRGIIAFVADGCGTLLMADASPEELRRLM